MKEDNITDNKTNIVLNYWVGSNAIDNWNIIDKADQNDLWFHLSDHASAHVILRISSDNLTVKKISKQTLIHCAQQCKLNSKFSNISNKMKVIYTEIKNVSKGENVGQVYTKKISIIHV